MKILSPALKKLQQWNKQREKHAEPQATYDRHFEKKKFGKDFRCKL